MARNGKVDYRDLRYFRENLEDKLSDDQIGEFIEACAKELAVRLLAKVIKRTPVGEYPSSSGKKGGTLRRGWTGEKRKSAQAYANSLKVNRVGGAYVIEVINPVEYASYVEYGHRTRNHKGWVEGKFMMTISKRELERDAPRVLENKLKKKLEECLE